MSWTDERVEQLKTLWGEGHSASQIAKTLGGVTRNAVIGKVHRLKLSNRNTDAAAKAKSKAKAIEQKAGTITAIPPVSNEPVVPVPLDVQTQNIVNDTEPMRHETSDISEARSGISTSVPLSEASSTLDDRAIITEKEVIRSVVDTHSPASKPMTNMDKIKKAAQDQASNQPHRMTPLASSEDDPNPLDINDDMDADDDFSAIENDEDRANAERHAALAKVEAKALKLTLLELTERTCKWPMGDPATNDFYFCGVPCEADKSYCEDHAKVAYQPVTSRRDRERNKKRIVATGGSLVSRF